MTRKGFDEMPCPIAQCLGVVGERWTLLVLREAFFRVRRFDDFQRRLGIARNILADRLSTLVDAGVLERRPYQDRPVRHEYRLTQKGLDLWPVLVALQAWGEKHAPAQSGPPIELTHTACGHRTVPQLACSHCGEPLGPRDVTAARELAGPAEFAAAARA
ncbi:MAG: helix-turn-helix domain-containing protein [Solirubrobacteraceae bacterium]